MNVVSPRGWLLVIGQSHIEGGARCDRVDIVELVCFSTYLDPRSCSPHNTDTLHHLLSVPSSSSLPSTSSFQFPNLPPTHSFPPFHPPHQPHVIRPLHPPPSHSSSNSFLHHRTTKLPPPPPPFSPVQSSPSNLHKHHLIFPPLPAPAPPLNLHLRQHPAQQQTQSILRSCHERLTDSSHSIALLRRSQQPRRLDLHSTLFSSDITTTDDEATIGRRLWDDSRISDDSCEIWISLL